MAIRPSAVPRLDTSELALRTNPSTFSANAETNITYQSQTLPDSINEHAQYFDDTTTLVEAASTTAESVRDTVVDAEAVVVAAETVVLAAKAQAVAAEASAEASATIATDKAEEARLSALQASGGMSFSTIDATDVNYQLGDQEGVVADTSSAPFTVKLPVSPTDGAICAIADGDNFYTNNLTVDRNGETIEGDAENFIIDVGGVTVTFIYSGGTWKWTASSAKSGNAQTYAVTEFTATDGQTTFAAAYTPPLVQVYYNGVLLSHGTDYTASDGANIVLTTEASVDSIIRIIAFTKFEVANAATASQGAKADSAAAAGTVFVFAGDTPPAGSLKADGATISRITYAALFAAIGTTYGAGDGSTTFELPDLRGEFIRGFDDGRGVDAGRALGSPQLDQFKSHSHDLAQRNSYEATGMAGALVPAGTPSSTPAETANEGGVETRPRNIAMLYCIRY